MVPLCVVTHITFWIQMHIFLEGNTSNLLLISFHKYFPAGQAADSKFLMATTTEHR